MKIAAAALAVSLITMPTTADGTDKPGPTFEQAERMVKVMREMDDYNRQLYEEVVRLRSEVERLTPSVPGFATRKDCTA